MTGINLQPFASVTGEFSLNGMNRANGLYRFMGKDADDCFGNSVSYAGDVNGDGFGDFLISADGGDDGGSNSGESYLIFGSNNYDNYYIFTSSNAYINASTLNNPTPSRNPITFIGRNIDDWAGASVSSAGDVNSDGFDDILIGAASADGGGSASGEAYLVFGRSDTDWNNLADNDSFNLDNISKSNNTIRFIGRNAGDRLGYPVCGAGDINGDGFDDFLVSADTANNEGGTSAGEIYLIFGRLNTDWNNLIDDNGDFNLDNISKSNNIFRFIGENADDDCGASISKAGDVNGDGFDDFIIGALYADGGGSCSGEAYLVFGRSGTDWNNLFDADGSFNLDNASKTNDIISFIGKNGADNLGEAVSSAGDVNGDGFADIIIGARGAGEKGLISGSWVSPTGEAYLVFGRESTDWDALIDDNGNFNLDNLSKSNNMIRFIGKNSGDNAGTSVSSAGDVNGDGFEDLLISATSANNSKGETYLVFGRSEADWNNLVDDNGDFNLDNVSKANKIINIIGRNSSDGSGGSISSVGDVNNDGFDDILIGAQSASDWTSFRHTPGEAYLILGRSNWYLKNIINGIGESCTLNGTEDEDLLNGTSNNDILYGNDGNDELDGKAGADTMYGGNGNDTFYVDNKGDIVIEDTSLGTDTVLASTNYTLSLNVENMSLTGSSNINCTGNEIDNSLTGSAGNNIIKGLAGNDTLDGSSGRDTLYGGIGDDTYYVDNKADRAIEYSGQGNDTIISNISYTLSSYIENLTLTDSNNINGTGNTVNNLITGNTGNNILNGDKGNDNLIGDEGDDTLVGGSGADTMTGGAGDDIYYVDNTNDFLIEDTGIDLCFSSVSHTLEENVENLVLTSKASNGTGNSLNNSITGNNYNNILDGGNGNDTLIGGKGNDIYYIDSSDDLIIESKNQGTDMVNSSIGYSLGMNLENLTIIGNSVSINGIGNSLNNRITGNEGDNYLYGYAGNDTLQGSAGNDTFEGGTGNDTYIFNACDNSDTISDTSGQTILRFGTGIGLEDLYFVTGNNDLIIAYYDPTETFDNEASATENSITVKDYYTETAYRNMKIILADGSTITNPIIEDASEEAYQGSNSNNVICGQDGNDTLVGYGGNDIIIGADGNDVLYGGADKDTIIGSIGDDTLFGSLGADTYLFQPGDGWDVIWDISSTNIIKFGEEIDLVDIAMFNTGLNQETNTYSDLLLAFRGANDAISIAEYCKYKNFKFAFADGVVLTKSTYDSLTYGTQDDDSLSGTSKNNTLIGRAGDDTLEGGAGNDTYIFSIGDMNDNITDTSGKDTIKFCADIDKDNIAFYMDETNLIIDYDGISDGGNLITVINQANATNRIEKIQLSNGKYLSSNDVNNIIQDIAAYDTAHTDITISGINDIVSNDELMVLISSHWHS